MVTESEKSATNVLGTYVTLNSATFTNPLICGARIKMGDGVTNAMTIIPKIDDQWAFWNWVAYPNSQRPTIADVIFDNVQSIEGIPIKEFITDPYAAFNKLHRIRIDQTIKLLNKDVRIDIKSGEKVTRFDCDYPKHYYFVRVLSPSEMFEITVSRETNRLENILLLDPATGDIVTANSTFVIKADDSSHP